VSVVTNLILIPGHDNQYDMDEEQPTWFDFINDELDHAGRIVLVSNRATSRKAMECDVYMAALNYASAESVRDILEAATWKDRTQVQFLVKEQEDEFTLYKLDEPR
jgi:hypothetical protein